ncbi:arginine--tRNA ligase [Cellulosilyticum ruminicola]|uniref:arginine--tRNA ligase n=1 Tax=Cellulosilyticum ruminicola TaxID=425254 RepID=UPI0006D1460B|nr:arginine--tRNA ligase [Cellulosilyticum ruminicola]
MKDFKLEIAQLLNEKINSLSVDDIYSMIEVPGNATMGDYAFPCFKLAKELRKAPPMIAKDIVDELGEVDFLDKVENVNAYINFFVNKVEFVKEVLTDVLTEKETYGFAKEKNLGNVVIDYSSPNIAKPFHVGHLRSTVIGNSLYQIFEALGYNCVGINHLGDWGTQFGKLIVAYKKYSSKETIEEKGISELLRIYVLFHDEAKEHPEMEQEARNYFTKMEQGDEESLALWKWFKEVSLKEFERVYKLLGVEFDSFNGEAFYNDKMDAVIKEMEDKGLIEVDQGAKLVRLDEENMAPCLITKNDGSSLYATRDITAAEYRKKIYDFKKCIYVTALQQNLHFAQWFKVIEKMGHEWHKDLVHVPFGMVSMEGGAKLSTRNGNIIFLEDILKEAVDKTKQIIEEKNPSLENKEEVARQVGIGAIVFDDMYNNIIKDIQFSWERALDFNGETGPYVQYAHARACSVLRKAGIELDSIPNFDVDYSVLADESTVALIKKIADFKTTIKEAANKYEPSYIARYAVDVTQAFNKFYNENPILVEDEKVKNSRLAIVVVTKYVLKNALALLGICAPVQM